jgi:ATP synthase subunit 6
MLYSPIEQFMLISFFYSIISNLTLFFILVIFIFFIIYFKIINNYFFLIKYYLFDSYAVFLFNSKYIDFKRKVYMFLNLTYFSFIPTKTQYMFEVLFFEFVNFIKNLINNSKLFNFFYIIIVSILFILFSNLIGLVPYTYTITAQIYMTFNLACLVFLTFNIIGIIKYTIELINLVIPTGVNILLNLLLIPIEVISYAFRPISLAIRLFANIMAGHTLLKVICGFIFNFIRSNIVIILILLPFILIPILFGLETFVACIQSYVFLILLCLFLKDILSLSH